MTTLPEYPFSWNDFHRWKKSIGLKGQEQYQYWHDEYASISREAFKIIQRPR